MSGTAAMDNSTPEGDRPEDAAGAGLTRRDLIRPRSTARGTEGEPQPRPGAATPFTRRAFISTGAVAFGAAVVWTSPFPFSDKGVGQLIDSAWASSPTGPTGTGPTTQTYFESASGTFTNPALAAGSLTINGGKQSVSWNQGAFEGATVYFEQSTLGSNVNGFKAGDPVYKLNVNSLDNGKAITEFPPPGLRIRIDNANGKVPAFSLNGVLWTSIGRISSPDELKTTGPREGYVVNADGSVDIYTLHTTYFAALTDVEAPTAPGSLTGRLDGGTLALTWTASTDNSGRIERYRLTLNGKAVQDVAGTATSATVKNLDPKGASAYALVAYDPSGNASAASNAVTVKRSPRPASAPRMIPAWAFKLLAWEQKPAATRGPQPTAPSPLPEWYGPWKAWRQAPFTLQA